MLVGVIGGARTVEVQERADPSPGRGEVLVKITAVGVCASDRHIYEDWSVGPYAIGGPLVLGHEAAGVVVELGPGCMERRPGERVVLEPGVSCGECRYCSGGRYNLCPKMRFLGTPALPELGVAAVDGAYAQYVTIGEKWAHPIPDDISDDIGALVEPLAVGLQAAATGGVAPGKSVLVTGAGAVGLMSVIAALDSGAEVAIAGRNKARLEIAESLGARIVTLGDDVQASGFDVLLECTGIPGVVERGLASLARGGHLVLAGGPGGAVTLDTVGVHVRALLISGLFRYVDMFPAAIATARNYRAALDGMVSARYPLRDIGRALEAKWRDDAVVRVIVHPN